MTPPPDTALALPPDVSLAAAPPHNLEAEMSVLGAILISERTLYALVIEEGLKPEDFYRQRHGEIYESMLALYRDGEPLDHLTVSEHLRQRGRLEQVGGAEAVEALAAAPPAIGNARRYAQIVRENALLRRLLTTSYEIQASVQDRRLSPRDLVEQAEKAMLEVAHDDRQADFRSAEEILHDELAKMQRLSLEGTMLTGTPSGFKDLDEITGGFQPGNLIILAARPSMGKCLGPDSLVYDPMTGARRRIEDVVAAHERGEDVWVASVAPDLRLRPSRVSAAFRNGRRPVFRLRTRLGREVVATANHPFMTMEGWKRLDAIGAGTRLAVPRVVPRRGAPEAMPDCELVLLAALIADGALGGRTPRFVGADGAPMLDVVTDAAGALGARVHRYVRRGNVQLSLCAPHAGGPNPATALFRRHGIMGLRSAEKFVPDAVFALDEAQIARFLSVLFACDGHIHATDRIQQAGLSTISERLARDVQHLLLRLGIVGKIRTLRRDVYEGTGKVAREVRITNQASLGALCELLDIPGKRDAQARVHVGLSTLRAKVVADTVPAAVWDRVLAVKGERSWAAVSRVAGHPANHNWHVGTRGLSRERLGRLATALEDEPLQHLASSDLWWDEVVSIELAGEVETFDLTVPGDHNFVADDVVVHNSALVTNIAENAAIDHSKAVALFSLEMSETELAQRFVASQGRIFGDKLRKGRVPESEWPRILDASQRLARAPLYVDDSSDIGILDIRAKARRLHAQAPGGLGLIIVDYLQLIRPDAGTDNRVEQVGAMSRGLKILARELEVPVIALSQLSRAVEQRHDKKPILSDLRESGQIEQDADLVMFIYRDEYYAKEESEAQGLAELLIAKHRNGGLGDVTLTFRKEYPKFLNYAGERYAA